MILFDDKKKYGKDTGYQQLNSLLNHLPCRKVDEPGPLLRVARL